MRRIFFSMTGIFLLGLFGCSQQSVPPLTPTERAAYVIELLEHRVECDHFRDQLKVPGLERNVIDQLYQDALRAGCIHKEV